MELVEGESHKQGLGYYIYQLGIEVMSIKLH